MKSCINCIHFSPATTGLDALRLEHGRCALTHTQKANPISGKIEKAFASINRMTGSACGPDAQWFEADNKAAELRNEIAAQGDC